MGSEAAAHAHCRFLTYHAGFTGFTGGGKMASSTAEKKRIVSAFLQRCLTYADDKLVQYRQQLPAATGMDALTVADKISHWTAYRAFTEYTIEELTTAELDAWFDE
jgi:DNA-binding phage protein